MRGSPHRSGSADGASRAPGHRRSRAAALTVTADELNVFTAGSAQGKLLESLGLRLADIGAAGTPGLSGGDGRKDVVSLSFEDAGRLGASSLCIVNADGADVAGYRDSNPVLAVLPAFAKGRVHALGPGVVPARPVRGDGGPGPVGGNRRLVLRAGQPEWSGPARTSPTRTSTRRSRRMASR
jgi:hypothetical protein